MAKAKNKDSIFNESLYLNDITYLMYYNNLTQLAMSMFKWHNLPETVDERFLELCLFKDGMCIFFEDEVLGYLALPCMIGGNMNVYNIPSIRTAYAANGYNKHLNATDSVIIFNNYLHTNCMSDVEMFSRRLYNLDRAIDVNSNAQKTPVLIQCDDNQRLTMKNLYKQYNGNEPFIFGTKSLDTNGIKVLQTGAPYVADKLFDLKTKIWNEALTYLGISNVSVEKKERLITDEVIRSQGGAIASRYARLDIRNQACDMINNMFGLDLWVEYKEYSDKPLSFYQEEQYE